MEETMVEQFIFYLNSVLNYMVTNGLSMGFYLLIGLILAAALESLVPAGKLHRYMNSYGVWPILIATVAAVTTPLCSCGTVSLMIPLLAVGVPWGPIFAWLIASPIISPTGFVLIGGALGWDLAVAKILAGLILGIGGGILANRLQMSGFLANQSRVPVNPVSGNTESCCAKSRFSTFTGTLWKSARMLVPIFVLFLLVAGVIQVFIPTQWITGLFGPGRIWGVPTAALLGVPIYTNTAVAVPLTASFMGLGMSKAAALAFLLTGPGASLPALGAVLVIARRRIVALYLGLLFAGSILFAYLFELWF